MIQIFKFLVFTIGYIFCGIITIILGLLALLLWDNSFVVISDGVFTAMHKYRKKFIIIKTADQVWSDFQKERRVE